MIEMRGGGSKDRVSVMCGDHTPSRAGQIF
jgi:hypothetical protein